MQRRRHLVPTLLAFLSTLLLAFAPASAQEASEQETDAPNNLVHPAGTETVPLGELRHVDVRGEGRTPLVLIPGASFEGDVWEPFMDRNLDRYTMMAITPPGYGDTAPWPMPEDNEAFTDHTWTDALIESIVRRVRDEGLVDPVVVGHHLMGDHYAMRLGLEYPDLFRGVVVVAGNPSQVPVQSDGTVADQIRVVNEMWKPFFRSVTRERWIQGTYPAAQFSVDPEHATVLFERQIATPIPTQIRYFLEYLTTNIALDLPRLEVPMLVIDQQPDFEAMMQGWVENAARQTGSEEVARERLEQQMIDRYGSLEQAEIALSRPWEPLAADVEPLRVEYIEDSGIFIMDDRPEVFDRALWEFVSGLRQ